jgi:putative phage-type endonuclease
MQIHHLTNREQWLQARLKFIGASESAALFDASPWESALSLYAKKLNLRGVALPSGNDEAIRWGSRFENAIADEWAERNKATLENLGAFTILTEGNLSATLDRKIVACKPIDFERPLEGPGALEIKKVAASKKAQWEDAPPIHYQIQVQHQLAVTGWKWAILAPLFIGEYSMELGSVVIERNDEFIAKLVQKANEFCQRFEKKMPPEADGSKATAEALAILHPNDNGTTIQFTSEQSQLIEDYESVTTTISSLEMLKREVKNRIVAALGDATYGECADGRRYSYKTVFKKKHVVEETTFRMLRKLGR